MSANSINSKLENIFKQTRALNVDEYEKVILNIELLKKKYFNTKFKKSKTKLFECKSFNQIIDLL